MNARRTRLAMENGVGGHRDLDGLQFTQGDRGQAGVDLKGDRIGSARLAMG